MYNQNNKKYTLNQRYFSKWSKNMAYILGFIYADGNMAKDKFRISIASKDLELLEQINLEIGSDRPIKLECNKNGQWWKLTIDNKYIYEDLKLLGLVPNKSFTCKVPHIPEEFKYDFIRGYFDGDGCIYIKNVNTNTPTASIDIATASKDFKDDLLKMLSDITDDKHKFSVQVRKNGLNIIRCNHKVSMNLYKKMYYENCLCLNRKKEKFDYIIKLRSRI